MDWGIIDQATQILGNGPSADYSQPGTQQLGTGPKGFKTDYAAPGVQQIGSGPKIGYAGSTQLEPYISPDEATSQGSTEDRMQPLNDYFSQLDSHRQTAIDATSGGAEFSGEQVLEAGRVGQSPNPSAIQDSANSTVNKALEMSGSDYRVPTGVETAAGVAGGDSEKNNLMNSGIVKLGKKVVGAVASFYTGGAAGAAMNVAGQQASEAGGSAGNITGMMGMF